MLCPQLLGCFLWTPSLTALKLLKPPLQSFFLTSKSNSVWFSPLHRFKSLAHKVACPGVIDCLNAHQLTFTEPLPWALPPLPPTRRAAPTARASGSEPCPKTLKPCGCCQHPLLVPQPMTLAGACRPPIFQAGGPNTLAVLSSSCQVMCHAVIHSAILLVKCKASCKGARVGKAAHRSSHRVACLKKGFPSSACL